MTLRLKRNGQSNLSQTVKRNIIMSIGIKTVGVFVSLFIVPITLGYLSEEEYGIWLTLSSMLAWIGFFDIGLTNGLRNKLTEALAVKDNERAKIYLSTTLFLLVSLMFVLLVIFGLCCGFIDWQTVFNSKTISLETLGKVAFYTITFFCIQFALKVVTALFYATQCAAIADFLNMLGSLGALIVIWLLTLVTPKGNLLAIALTFSIVPVVVLMIAYIIVFGGKYRSISPSVKYIFTTSNFIITQLFGPSEVTMYNIAFKYFSIATMAFTVLMAPMWNAYTEAYVRGDYIWMRNAFHKTLLIWGSIVLCSVLMLVFSRWAYELWVGVKVASQIPISLSIGCTLFVTIANWGNVTAMLLNGIGKIQIQLIVGSLMAVLYIPLSVLMGNYIGVAGVLYALCVVSLPGAILGMVQVNKILNRTAGGVWAK